MFRIRQRTFFFIYSSFYCNFFFLRPTTTVLYVFVKTCTFFFGTFDFPNYFCNLYRWTSLANRHYTHSSNWSYGLLWWSLRVSVDELNAVVWRKFVQRPSTDKYTTMFRAVFLFFKLWRNFLHSFVLKFSRIRVTNTTRIHFMTRCIFFFVPPLSWKWASWDLGKKSINATKYSIRTCDNNFIIRVRFPNDYFNNYTEKINFWSYYFLHIIISILQWHKSWSQISNDQLTHSKSKLTITNYSILLIRKFIKLYTRVWR